MDEGTPTPNPPTPPTRAYLVGTGDYEDYAVDRVFLDKDLAEEFVRLHNESSKVMTHQPETTIMALTVTETLPTPIERWVIRSTDSPPQPQVDRVFWSDEPELRELIALRTHVSGDSGVVVTGNDKDVVAYEYEKQTVRYRDEVEAANQDWDERQKRIDLRLGYTRADLENMTTTSFHGDDEQGT